MSYDKTISADLYDQKWEDGTITITMKRGASVPVIVIKVTGAELTGSYTLSVKADAGAAEWSAAKTGELSGDSVVAYFTKPGAEPFFVDVVSGAWYESTVRYAAEAGLMAGTGDGRFSPEVTTTRGMIVTILHRMETGVSDQGTPSPGSRWPPSFTYEHLTVVEHPQPVKEFSIQFEKVSFSYPGANQKAVDDVSFTIPQGNTVALVGASGGGKTTIARLVPRFWEATEGKVLIGGINVREIAPEELMKYISFVFQNTKLFKTSLLENIKYGNPDATMEEVERAVDMAQCREIINKLPLGLNTKIGTEGTYLSGGEQQRIVLARAILKNAPIIVLDEATAFADPENEHLIQQALKELTKGKTVLMIAHRLSSITDADNILVIDKGKIAEQGTHANLLGKQGIYYHMWNEYQQSVRWTIGKEVSND